MVQADLELNLTTKRTRKREFLAEMGGVAPWTTLVKLVVPHTRDVNEGRPPLYVKTMLPVDFMQQWFTLSGPTMEESAQS